MDEHNMKTLEKIEIYQVLVQKNTVKYNFSMIYLPP